MQHFSMNQGKFFRVYCGHCTFVKPKKKLPDHKACGNFASGPAPEESFVKKEYLSKELLDYVLRLELLPQSEGLPQGDHDHSSA